jgi:hypothetical protein
VGVIRTLSNWLDRRGDLMTVGARIFQLGPLIAVGVVLTFIWRGVSSGVAFWIVAAASMSACLVYFIAFVKAFARQRERFYQREASPHLSREYRDR